MEERDRLEENPNLEGDLATQDAEQELYGYDWILHCLKQHAERLRNANYEDTKVAELISRALIAITKGCNSYISQKYINQAIEVIKPLWEQYCFYIRHIRALS